ncbi:hypothetical protein VTO73DRAFT_1807 [Trametes versicolor]
MLRVNGAIFRWSAVPNMRRSEYGGLQASRRHFCGSSHASFIPVFEEVLVHGNLPRPSYASAFEAMPPSIRQYSFYARIDNSYPLT